MAYHSWGDRKCGLWEWARGPPSWGHLVRCARSFFQVLSDLWYECASVSPLWKKEVLRMFIQTLIWIRVHIFSYTAVGRLGMAFHLGVLKSKHASPRQREWKVRLAVVGTLCPRSKPPGEVVPQSTALEGKVAWLRVASAFRDPEDQGGLGEEAPSCRVELWVSVLLLLLPVCDLLDVSPGPIGSLVCELSMGWEDILGCPQAQALLRRVPGALSRCVARVSIGCLFPLTLYLSQKYTYYL